MEAKEERKLVKLSVDDVTEEKYWNPEEIGDSIEGIFVKVKPDVGEYRSNLYTLEVEGKEKLVWGSARLDELFQLIEGKEGIFVKIIYKGIKNFRAKGKYMNKMKTFDLIVDKENAPEKHFYELDAEGEAITPTQLMENDDPEARNTIEYILGEIAPNKSCKEILKYADANKEDLDLGEEELKRIVIQCGKMFKV